MQTAFRLIAWLLSLAIVALSVMPAPTRPTTIAGSGAEHFLIFLLLGLAAGVGYSRVLWRVAVALTLFAGAIELAQFFAPGRHPRLSDFIIDLISSGFGLGLSILLAKLYPRLVHQRDI